MYALGLPRSDGTGFAALSLFGRSDSEFSAATVARSPVNNNTIGTRGGGRAKEKDGWMDMGREAVRGREGEGEGERRFGTRAFIGYWTLMVYFYNVQQLLYVLIRRFL